MDEVINTKVEETNSNTQENIANGAEKKGVEANQETPEQINWKRFREAREQDRKAKEIAERDAAKKAEEVSALKAAMESLLNKPQSHQMQSEPEDLTEDQRIDKRVEEAIAKRDRQYAEEKQRREQQEFPQRLVANFSDFDQVCNTSNLDYLEYHHPELAKSLGSREDGFDKWADIYSAIKRYIPNTETRKEQAKAESNFKKPQSISSPGVTQGGNAMPSARLDEQRKADNWNRMQKILKGLT